MQKDPWPNLLQILPLSNVSYKIFLSLCHSLGLKENLYSYFVSLINVTFP